MTKDLEYPPPRLIITEPEELRGVPQDLFDAVCGEIKGLLHASRDCLRNKKLFDQEASDPAEISFHAADGYYGEAFGILRALHLQGYGVFGAVNIDAMSNHFRGPRGAHRREQNLSWWFSRLQTEVLLEEGWNLEADDPNKGRCEYCLERYRKDDKSMRENLYESNL